MRWLTDRSFSLVLGSLLAFSAISCGGGKQKEAEPPPYELDNEQDGDDGMEVMQEFGGMNEEKVNKTLERLYPELQKCLMTAYDRVDFIGGEVAFLVKVNLAGQAQAAHAERSTLGDYQSEQCMLDKIRATRWPKPVGGRIGLARSSIIFDPPEDVRTPVQWSSEDVETTLEAHADELSSCGGGGPFSITAYINVDGSVMTAGVGHADDAGQETASCLVGAVERITFPSPGSWPAKVTFQR